MGIRDAIAERLDLARDIPRWCPSARRWIQNDLDRSVGSFLWILQSLGLRDACSIRFFVESATEDDLDRLRHAFT